MYIEQLYTNCLAEAAYYIESDGEAAIIDPLRETEPYLALANKRGAKIKYVFETHFHADFVSGHIDLANKVNAPIVYGPLAETSYKVYNAKDGEEFTLGKLKIRVLHTPGHTPESSCFLLLNEQGNPHAIFTGDTLFVGDVGRPDLLDGVMTPQDLAGMLYDSLTSKIKTLPDAVIVYPAHGPGSACGKNIGKETFSTIGEQRKFNYALQPMSREEFIQKVTDGILPPPQYFFEDARINKMGYDPLEKVIAKNTKPLSPEEIKIAVANGATILDTRKADDFEKGFVPGAINIGLNGQFAVWVGTLIDIAKPLVLIAEEGKEEESVLRLARVGYENVLGYLQNGIRGWTDTLSTVRSIHAEDMKSEMKAGAVVADVRKPGEWSTAHVKDATFLPLADFPNITESLDKNKSYLVHCGGGYRSMTAVSIMAKQGFKNLTNIYGGFGAMQQAGLEVETDQVLA
ncbi:MBL fold metallo-hydrolase [Pseudochryseolinea flava]|uniref:MBL fold metallo-hydrolase n=1 Tax=Pseudochryseolinea flava TaxID=2059302 RepID=A0A364Y1G7_9BACT|nr:rhodanese-like domain-containing protein [Pseudochryseolinea flava]RAV99789.1 MBL fold metallo-hydrolase [Pseudochryseolinea flava]